MYNAATVAESIHLFSKDYGLESSVAKSFADSKFDWAKVKQARDGYIKRLNAIYERNVSNEHVDEIKGLASFTGKNQLQVKHFDGTVSHYEAKHVLIATGKRGVLWKKYKSEGRAALMTLNTRWSSHNAHDCWGRVCYRQVRRAKDLDRRGLVITPNAVQ
jgi:pyruvate/2-oxoglutarate dehydrogenase complex dihydrolipoamide dehydrogenase (E3) component